MSRTTASRFTGKVALLTGGAAGIGLAVAQALMDEGAKVYIVDYSHPNIKSASQALKLAGYSQSAYVLQYADAADDASVIAFVNKCVEQFGGLDVAVLNAGLGGKQKPLWECSADEYDLVMRINARGPFLGVKHSAEKMKSLGTPGNIVLTASVAAMVGTAGLCAYSMSKFAVRGLTATAALEYGQFNIRVNSVAPGVVDTDMPQGLNDVQALVSSTPISRMAQPGEIAKLITFLASDDSSFVTGCTYRIDGGSGNCG
ncbi:hypothetical protein BDV19DRAFT_356774 [Aspergillus venezuelensis]